MGNQVRAFLDANPEYAKRPIVRRGRGSIHLRREDGKIEALCFGAPIHYQDEKGEWQEIDTTLRDMGDGSLGAPGIPFRLTRDGKNRVSGGTFSQRTVRVGLWDAEKGEFTAQVTLPSLRNVSDDTLYAEGDWWRHELRVTASALHETLTIKKEPPQLRKVPDGQWIVLETEFEGLALTSKDAETDWFADGMLFPPPRAEDATNTMPVASDGSPLIRRWAKTVSGKQIVYTGVRADWLKKAQYPVVIDPDYAGDTVDGMIQGQGDSYDTARSTSYYHETNGTTLTVGQSGGGESRYNVYRIFVRFDTSGIPDSATVTQVNLKLTCISDYSSTDFDVQIVKQDWSGQCPISDSNRETAYDNCLSGTADSSIWRNTSGISTNTPYTSGNLSTSWVNKTGYTYYSLRSSRDYSATTPTGDEWIQFAATEHTTASYRPYLVVTYEEITYVDESLTLSTTRSVTFSPSVVIEDGISLSQPRSTTVGAGAEISDDVTLAITQALQAQGTALIGESISLGHIEGLTADVSVVIEEMMALVSTLEMTISAMAEIDESLALATALTLSAEIIRISHQVPGLATAIATRLIASANVKRPRATGKRGG